MLFFYYFACCFCDDFVINGVEKQYFINLSANQVFVPCQCKDTFIDFRIEGKEDAIRIVPDKYTAFAFKYPTEVILNNPKRKNVTFFYFTLKRMQKDNAKFFFTNKLSMPFDIFSEYYFYFCGNYNINGTIIAQSGNIALYYTGEDEIEHVISQEELAKGFEIKNVLSFSVRSMSEYFCFSGKLDFTYAGSETWNETSSYFYHGGINSFIEYLNTSDAICINFENNNIINISSFGLLIRENETSHTKMIIFIVTIVILSIAFIVLTIYVISHLVCNSRWDFWTKYSKEKSYSYSDEIIIEEESKMEKNNISLRPQDAIFKSLPID